MTEKNLFGICPYVTTQKLLSGKWSLLILHNLAEGPVRFNELRRQMPGDMTHTTLSRQLKSLEADGLILRKEYSSIPPKVEYQLSEIGKKFDNVSKALRQWGDDYIDYLKSKENL